MGFRQAIVGLMNRWRSHLVMVTHIRSEQNAWDFLFQCWNDVAYGNDGAVVFDSCELSIRLDPGDGRGDWKANHAIGLLQRHLNLTYLLAKHGELKGRVYNRELLSVAHAIRVGSTNHGIDVTKALGAIQNVLPAHWSPRARSIVTVGVLLATFSLPFASEFRTYRSAIDTTQITANASLEAVDRTNRAKIEIAQIHANAQVAVSKVQARAVETSTIGKAEKEPDGLPFGNPAPVDAAAMVLARLARTDPSRVVWFAASDFVPWRPALLDLAPYSGSIQWNNGAPIPAAVAKAVAKVARAEATKQRRIAKDNGHRGIIATPWVTEVLRTHDAPGAMHIGLSDA